jgi:hypothetical protein
MTQEEKNLLLKDLCSRLPYNCMVSIAEGGIDGIKWADLTLNAYLFYQIMEEDAWEYVKPYLRPLSSMTDEEREEYGKVCELDTEILANHPMNGEPFPALYNSQDWLNKKMFAYRTIDGKDMFELGLALEAPEGMYK